MIELRLSRLQIKLSFWKPLAYSIYWKYKAPKKDERGVTSYGFGHSLRFHAPLRHPKPNYVIAWHSKLQNWLQGIGISTCNPIRQECTQGFECCSWALSNADRNILSAVSGKTTTEDVHVVKVNEGVCVMCGSVADTRQGCCYECGIHTHVDNVEGVTMLRHTLTGKVVAL